MLRRVGMAVCVLALYSAAASAQIGGNGINKATSVLGNPQTIPPNDVLAPVVCAGGPAGPDFAPGTVQGYVVITDSNGKLRAVPSCW